MSEQPAPKDGAPGGQKPAVEAPTKAAEDSTPEREAPASARRNKSLEVIKSSWPKIRNKLKTIKWWLGVERLRTLLEIAAIIIAGWWAYTRFVQGEAPSLVPRGDIQGSLEWFNYSDGECQAEYEVEFKNIGKVPIEITLARLSVWSSNEIGEITRDNSVTFLDPLKINSSRLLEQYVNNDLAGVYAPDERAKHGFGFILKYEPKKRVLFRVDLYQKGEGKPSDNIPAWTDFRWDWVCGSPAPSPSPSAQSTGD